MKDITQRTLLFLIADTGAGHRSAANAIHNAISLLSKREQAAWHACSDGSPPPPTYRVKIVDVFEEYSRFPLRQAMKLYGPTIRFQPSIFGRLFHQSNHERFVLAANMLANPLIHQGLINLFTSLKPDVIVSVHPLINFAAVRALKALDLKIPFLTVVTDLISIHYSWFAPGADCYIVPTEEARHLYLKRHLDPRRVEVVGMPIDPKFCQPLADKEEIRRSFGLKPDLPAILLVGGGDGAGGLQSAVEAISRAKLPVQLMVITGRNKKLYEKLINLAPRISQPLHVFGFVQNMPEFMHAADLLITKAGPGTISEALACKLPMILSGFVPGQEEGNVRFVVENEIGVLAQKPAELIAELENILKPGSLLLQKRLNNAERFSHPSASVTIAQRIIDCLPSMDLPSLWEQHNWQPGTKRRPHLRKGQQHVTANRR